MKKIVVILSVLVGVVFANFYEVNEVKTDIYFGNGIWNSQFSDTDCAKNDAAECSKKMLNRVVEDNITKNDPKLTKRYGEVKLSYNWSQGRMMDLLESYYQLKKSGQVGFGKGFFQVISAFTSGNLGDSIAAFFSLAMMPIVEREEQRNVDEMWRNYYNKSFKLSHKVLLVSHSQGGLFANRIYDGIVPKGYQDYFANLQVGSPASQVNAKHKDHVTLYGDPINLISGNMSPNVEGAGHEFVAAYLDNNASLHLIIAKMKGLLRAIESQSSQWQTKSTSGEKTKEYRAKVEHRFDKEVNIFEDVYPFNLAGYVYKTPISTSTEKVYVKGSFGGEKILDKDVDEWEGKKAYQLYRLEGTEPVEYIEGERPPVYIHLSRPWGSITSVRFHMTDGEKSVTLHNALSHGFSIKDGPQGFPPKGYDRYKDSKWVGTKYEGKFSDMVVAVLPFESEKGWWCNNYYRGNCNYDNRNFPTHYTIKYSDYLDKIYKDNFLNPTTNDKPKANNYTQEVQYMFYSADQNSSYTQ